MDEAAEFPGGVIERKRERGKKERYEAERIDFLSEGQPWVTSV